MFESIKKYFFEDSVSKASVLVWNRNRDFRKVLDGVVNKPGCIISRWTIPRQLYRETYKLKARFLIKKVSYKNDYVNYNNRIL